MTTSVLGSVLLAWSLVSAPPAAAQERKSTRERFVELASRSDEAGCEKLWREHPYEVLYAIDADLEGALAAWEQAPDAPDWSAIQARHRRALWGARIATRVSGHPIFLDYTSAYVGFDDTQKQQFRAGQAAYKASRGALQAKDFVEATESGRRCAELAAPLGDWWGFAMGLSAAGQASLAAGKAADAIAPLSQAALVYRDLQLAGDEYSALRGLVQALVATGANERALATITHALELAAILDDADGRLALLEARMTVEGQLGDLEAAAATKEELEAARRR